MSPSASTCDLRNATSRSRSMLPPKSLRSGASEHWIWASSTVPAGLSCARPTRPVRPLLRMFSRRELARRLLWLPEALTLLWRWTRTRLALSRGMTRHDSFGLVDCHSFCIVGYRIWARRHALLDMAQHRGISMSVIIDFIRYNAGRHQHLESYYWSGLGGSLSTSCSRSRVMLGWSNFCIAYVPLRI